MSGAATVALIPAAGRARRLPGLACSKEIVPVGGGPDGPRAVCDYLLDGLAAAGVGEALWIVRPEKGDIRRHLAGRAGPPRLDFVEIADSASVPETLDRAYERVAGRRVVLGFPDIVVRPRRALAELLAAHAAAGTDLALALLPTRHPEKADMVELDPSGAPRRLFLKQPDRGLRYTWSYAVWGPRLTELLHAAVGGAEPGLLPRHREPYVGDLLAAALDRGLTATAVAFPDGDSLDVGDPASLAAARAELGWREPAETG